jgi:hypothetical protein
MSNLAKHAHKEFYAAGWCTEDGKFKDEMQQAICQDVLDLLELFGNQGHSGTTAPYALSLFDKLARWGIIAPLTGEDDEWSEVGDGVFQNNRCSHVFKTNEQAYDIDGIIWEDENGHCYTNYRSRVNVTFPYTPKSEYRKAENEVPKDNGF